MNDEDKKKFIIPVIAFLIGTIVGALILLFISPIDCPECEQCESLKEEIKIEDRAEVKSSTVKEEITNHPIMSESNVPLPVSECGITVDIAGAVNDPGVYCFKEGSKIVDVVKKAKGFAKGVAYKYVAMKINLSELITNHQKIYIPFEEDVYCEVKNLQYIDTPQEPPKQEENNNDTSDSTQTCININTASKDQLTTLNGIGDSTAQKIIDARPYTKPEDILNVSGIGESTYQKFKDDICVY
jgi:competence protein ComEA